MNKSPEREEIKEETPNRNTQAPQAMSQQPDAAEAFTRLMSAPAPALTPADIISLQQMIGNQAVQRVLVERSRGGAQKDESRPSAPSTHLDEKTETGQQKTRTGQQETQTGQLL